MDKFNDVAMAIFMLFFAFLGIACIIGFLLTWMWHCLLFAGMSAGMIWAWYYEDYKSKGNKLSSLWQKKNTRH